MRVGGLTDAGTDRRQLSERVWLLGRCSATVTIHVVLQHEDVLFPEIQDDLEMGTDTLAQPLKTLCQVGAITSRACLLVQRRSQQILWRAEHIAAAKACDLDPVFDALTKWAQHHALDPASARGLGPLRRGQGGHVIP